MNIDIIKQYKDWIVVNKPAGLSVHNSEDKTNLLKELFKQTRIKYVPVHRLDKETSGIILLSSNSQRTNFLQKTLKSENTIKKYNAIVKGKIAGFGQWISPLTNKAESRLNPMGIKSERVSCTTLYKSITSNQYLTLLEVEILTGRQHQIRKHAAISNHQIIGDKRYGQTKYNKLIKEKYDFNNMCLHSSYLYIDSVEGTFEFKAPIPEDWKQLNL